MERPQLENIFKSENSPVHQEIHFIFEQNPELASIGTIEQYARYLETIFPTSNLKEILYHGTDSLMDNYDFNKETREHTASVTDKKIASFTKDKSEAEYYANKTPTPTIITAILDIGEGKAREVPATNIVYAYKPEEIHILGSQTDKEKFKEFITNKN